MGSSSGGGIAGIGGADRVRCESRRLQMRVVAVVR
jgi:hypothetical protein